MQVQTPVIDQIQDILPQLSDHRLEAYCLIQSIRLWQYYPTSDLEALASQVLELFKHFDDPDLKCKFYISMTDCYQEVENDLGRAANMCKELISLATQTGNISRHSAGLSALAWINIWLGKHSVAQIDACECQKLSRISGNFYGEANAVHIQAVCWKELGDYKKSLTLCTMAQNLLDLCGMSGSEVNIGIMNIQAEVHKCKSEYSQAWKIQTQILQISADRHAYWHALALLNLAEIAVSIGAQKYDVQRNIDLARSIFTTLNLTPWIISCDAVLADLYMREKDLPAAKRLLKKCLELATDHNEIKLFCFEQLGNTSSWGADKFTPGWTTIFLVNSLKLKAKLEIYKALQFWGQMFLAQKDEGTAISLFTVALEAFTYMDVHRSRAECMLRLGDIYNRYGDLLKAVELWETARPLFERSSQVKDVQCVDERLSRVGNNVPDHHREHIAHLVVPSGNLFHIKEQEQVESIYEPLNKLTM